MLFFAKIGDFGKTTAKDRSALKKYISYQQCQYMNNAMSKDVLSCVC